MKIKKIVPLFMCLCLLFGCARPLDDGETTTQSNTNGNNLINLFSPYPNLDNTFFNNSIFSGSANFF